MQHPPPIKKFQTGGRGECLGVGCYAGAKPAFVRSLQLYSCASCVSVCILITIIVSN